MERFGGQYASPPNSYRRGFAAVSHFLPPCRAGALANDQPQMSPGMSAPRRSTRHETTTGILPLAQPSSSVKNRKLTARLQDTRIGRCYLAPELDHVLGARCLPGARVY